jgi:hypothetical protein
MSDQEPIQNQRDVERDLPTRPDRAWSPEGARWALGYQHGCIFADQLWEAGGGEGPNGLSIKVPTLTADDVERAEKAAKQEWESLGETQHDRIAAVKAKMLDVSK